MASSSPAARALLLGVAMATALGCSAEAAPPEEAVGASPSGIIGTQRSAAAYTEAVQVKVNNAFADFCTGVLVAPNVVVTAAHCVAFNAGGTWTITAPFAAGGAQTRTSSSAEPMEAAFLSLTRNNYDSHPELHDIGLVYLPTPFTGVGYASFSSTRYPLAGTTPLVSAVGRKTVSATAALVLSAAVALSSTTASDGYLNDNKTPRITDGGDSGGPLFLEGTHTLVGTETRFDPNKNLDFWVRLDGAVFDFLTNRVASHGGSAETLESYRVDVSSALCGRVSACCKASAPTYAISSAACTSVYDRLGFDGTARGMLDANAANVTVDPVAKAACLAKISNTADCSVSSAEMKAAVADCIAALQGKLAIGASCKATIECAGESVCEKSAAGVGTCQALRAAGQSCQVVDPSAGGVEGRDNLAQDLCSKRGGGATGLFCDAYDPATGAYRPEGSWTCQAARALGQGCSTDSYCSSMVCSPSGEPAEFTCVTDAPFVTPAVCTAFSL